MTKAQQVRELMINTCVANEGCTLETAMPLLVKPVMELGGFHRQLARAYIKNNWLRCCQEAQGLLTAQRPVYVPAEDTAAEDTAKERQLSMTPSAIRKRDQRARARALREAAEQVS